MSVVVIVKIPLDPNAAMATASSQAKADEMRAMADKRKAAGCLSHRFAAGVGELVMIDEWDTADAFTTFFADPKIAANMARAGASTPPEVAIYPSMDTPDRF